MGASKLGAEVGNTAEWTLREDGPAVDLNASQSAKGKSTLAQDYLALGSLHSESVWLGLPWCEAIANSSSGVSKLPVTSHVMVPGWSSLLRQRALAPTRSGPKMASMQKLYISVWHVAVCDAMIVGPTLLLPTMQRDARSPLQGILKRHYHGPQRLA